MPRGDHYMHLADLSAYVKIQEQVGNLYKNADAWTGRAIKNVGHSGKFSSDRTISQYASEIWNAKPCPVD
jgi:starch phosphorylase